MYAARLTSTIAKISASLILTLAGFARAGEVSTQASAGSNPVGPGTATAAATANGAGVNYTRTDTRSGDVSIGRGVAINVAPDGGISLSTSNAVATRSGQAVATNFNLTIGRDGRVASSGGISTAVGGVAQTVHVGGFATTGGSGGPTAGSTAGGRSDPVGRVAARTWSDTRTRPRFTRR